MSITQVQLYPNPSETKESAIQCNIEDIRPWVVVAHFLCGEVDSLTELVGTLPALKGLVCITFVAPTPPLLIAGPPGLSIPQLLIVISSNLDLLTQLLAHDPIPESTKLSFCSS